MCLMWQRVAFTSYFVDYILPGTELNEIQTKQEQAAPSLKQKPPKGYYR